MLFRCAGYELVPFQSPFCRIIALPVLRERPLRTSIAVNPRLARTIMSTCELQHQVRFIHQVFPSRGIPRDEIGELLSGHQLGVQTLLDPGT